MEVSPKKNLLQDSYNIGPQADFAKNRGENGSARLN